MREIKFRAWDGSRMFFDKDFNLHTIYKNQINDGKEPDILMQFTGLLDKNGKEIYEGDVICHTLSKHFMGMKPFRRWLVCEWDEGGFYWKRIRFEGEGEDENMGGRWTIHNFHESCPIVGNIYENPDFLKNDN